MESRCRNAESNFLKESRIHELFLPATYIINNLATYIIEKKYYFVTRAQFSCDTNPPTVSPPPTRVLQAPSPPPPVYYKPLPLPHPCTTSPSPTRVLQAPSPPVFYKPLPLLPPVFYKPLPLPPPVYYKPLPHVQARQMTDVPTIPYITPPPSCVYDHRY